MKLRVFVSYGHDDYTTFAQSLDKYSASSSLPFCQSCDCGTQFEH